MRSARHGAGPGAVRKRGKSLELCNFASGFHFRQRYYDEDLCLPTPYEELFYMEYFSFLHVSVF